MTKKSIKNFTVIDQRTNPEIGSVMHHKDEVKVVFENGADKDLKDWFTNNPVRGQNDMVLVLENLNISEDKKEKYSIGKLN
jgi:hypothetical protein